MKYVSTKVKKKILNFIITYLFEQISKHFTQLRSWTFTFSMIYFLGLNFYPRLFLPGPGGKVYVHVRLRDGCAGLQQGADWPGDGGDDGL